MLAGGLNIYDKDEYSFEKCNHQIIKLYDAVPAPVASTRDALAEKPQIIKERAEVPYAFLCTLTLASDSVL